MQDELSRVLPSWTGYSYKCWTSVLQVIAILWCCARKLWQFEEKSKISITQVDKKRKMVFCGECENAFEKLWTRGKMWKSKTLGSSSDMLIKKFREIVDLCK